MTDIIFLGTGGDKSVVGRQLRSSGGIIIRDGGTQLHIDPGPGALVKAREYSINLRGNTAVIVTHHHLGHSNDVSAVIEAMTLGGFDKKGILIANKTFINGAEGYIRGLSDFHASFLEKILILDEGRRIGIEHIEISSFKTKHDEPNSFGIKITLPNLTLGYSSDTEYSQEIIEGLADSDILILNVISPGEEKAGKNGLNRAGAVRVLAKIRPKLAIITHFGFAMLKADPLQEAREIQKASGIQTIAAHDGLSVTPSSYAARGEQKRLNQFS